MAMAREECEETYRKEMEGTYVRIKGRILIYLRKYVYVRINVRIGCLGDECWRGVAQVRWLINVC